MLGVYMLFLVGCHKREDQHQTVLEESFILEYDDEELQLKEGSSKKSSELEEGERISEKGPNLTAKALQVLDESARLRVSVKGGGGDEESNGSGKSNPDSSNVNGDANCEVMEVEDF